MESGIQLEMNFEPNRNRFRTRLGSGEFFLLFEINTPSRQADMKAAAERLQETEFAVSAITALPAGLAITDKYTAADTAHICDFTAALAPGERDRHLYILSGRDCTSRNMRDNLKLCHHAGMHNLLLVSGNAAPGEESRQTAARHYCDSVNAIHFAHTGYPEELFVGGAVNPFKYTPDELFGQYFKLVKKINCGAEFFVANFGWDMLKFQELRWYLSNRGLNLPGIARLMMLTPEKFESIAAGKIPGIRISPDFQIILQNELKYSFTQFEAAQWRRLQLQAAGCRLLGYNGIQISGVERPDKIRIAAARISEALEEFQHFDDWSKAYHEHLARAEMAPYPHRFYLFNKLFASAHPETAPPVNHAQLPTVSRWERYYYELSRFMFAHAGRQSPDEHYYAKRLLVGCSRCERCRLPETCFICPNTCPKGLSNGPCGGSRPGGRCEVAERECIHQRIMRLNRWRNSLDQLEEHYIPPGN
ncbi:MAG: methylenetetrahydrofolate reductase C-terminal domain-containing protein [Victivallales bacterium]|nr:methylenetetrahydrofolate reductase C-terminal domain-containing protein [Victivallales bacterium]